MRVLAFSGGDAFAAVDAVTAGKAEHRVENRAANLCIVAGARLEWTGATAARAYQIGAGAAHAVGEIAFAAPAEDRRGGLDRRTLAVFPSVPALIGVALFRARTLLRLAAAATGSMRSAMGRAGQVA